MCVCVGMCRWVCVGYDCVWSLNKCVFPEVTLYSTRQSYVENITELKQNASNDGELISFFLILAIQSSTLA